MKRLLLIPVALVVAALVILIMGRAPSDYAIEEECRRFHNDRRSRAQHLREQLERLEAKLAAGSHVEGDAMRVRAELDETLALPREADLGSWEIRILPPRAGEPDAAIWLLWGPFDTGEASDHRSVRGAYAVWMRPTGTLARMATRLRLTP
ncbi:MAG: hypothetical protein ACYTGZ_19355 [Planctomycetota bacterium]|jgi:hypothetical protein